MVISLNPEPAISEFKSLLDKTLLTLTAEANHKPNEFMDYLGNKLEKVVYDCMSYEAEGTPFKGTIKLVAGQKFPDIVAKGLFGVEVKSTKQSHWTTTGNSVLEGTRIDGIKKIFLLFGKMSTPIGFKCRPYEDCISEVVVTHSPRYQIDMNLRTGDTIFDKLNIPYDNLRDLDNPITPILKYYKSFLQPGQQVWWLDNDISQGTKLVIRLWNNLSSDEKRIIIVKSLMFFPEIFSNRNDKYSRLSLWLLTQEAIICPNIRDLFTAKGKDNVTINDIVYPKVPRVFVNLFQMLEEIALMFANITHEELNIYWPVKTTEKLKLEDWMQLVINNSEIARDAKHLNIGQMMLDKLASIK